MFVPHSDIVPKETAFFVPENNRAIASGSRGCPKVGHPDNLTASDLDRQPHRPQSLLSKSPHFSNLG